jgi:hypothetical protein
MTGSSGSVVIIHHERANTTADRLAKSPNGVGFRGLLALCSEDLPGLAKDTI